MTDQNPAPSTSASPAPDAGDVPGSATGLSVLALVCTLTPSPTPSSSELMARHLLDRFEAHGVGTSSVRVVDHVVRPGVQVDMGDGDEWPAIRQQVLAADILLLATPIWMGHPASVAQQVLERLDDVGFSLPAQGGTYWVGEAMQSVDYKDLGAIPDPVAATHDGLVRNAVHLARLLREHPYPAG